MSIPKYHEILLPLLKKYSDNLEHHRSDFIEELAGEFELNDDEVNQKIKAGWTRFGGRVHWALTFLKHSNLIKPTRRGYYIITAEGKKVLNMNLEYLNSDILLEMYPELMQTKFWNKQLREPKDKNDVSVTNEDLTPEENFEDSLDKIKDDLTSRILDEVKSLSPKQFETLVVKLLEAMDYGTGTVTSYTNDGGIDGIIQADELGLEKIFIQAKKYEANVGRPDMQKFIGAIEGTSKAVFITTSDFASSVHEYLRTRNENVILINGEKLVDLMYEYNQGVTVRKLVEIKTLDTDYFEEL